MHGKSKNSLTASRWHGNFLGIWIQMDQPVIDAGFNGKTRWHTKLESFLSSYE
jgi:hypothetical protein